MILRTSLDEALSVLRARQTIANDAEASLELAKRDLAALCPIRVGDTVEKVELIGDMKRERRTAFQVEVVRALNPWAWSGGDHAFQGWTIRGRTMANGKRGKRFYTATVDVEGKVK